MGKPIVSATQILHDALPRFPIWFWFAICGFLVPFEEAVKAGTEGCKPVCILFLPAFQAETLHLAYTVVKVKGENVTLNI